jgi:hypothetical protein
MFWILVVAMGALAFGFIKVRRQRKARPSA